MPTMTGFGWQSQAKLASADGYAYQAWLWKKSYAGDVNAVRLTAGGPCVVSWGRKGSDIYVPVLASHAEIRGWRLTTELEDLIGARTGDWRLEIVRGADQDTIDAGTYTRYWLGQVLADVYEDSTMGGPSEVMVQAVDGLGTLREIPYYDTSTPGSRLAYTGRESLLTILRRALGKIGYDLPIRSAVAWRPSAVTGAEDPLAEIDVDNLSFYSIEGEAMSCYDVAQEIARRCGARLCQWEGAWWLVSRELMTGTAYTVFQYTDAGVADGTTTAGAGVDATAAGVVRTAGSRTFRPAWSRAAVLQNHGPVPPLVDEGDFAISGGEFKLKGYWFVTTRPVYTSGSWSYTGNAEAREADPLAQKRVTQAGTTAVAERNFVHSVPSYFHGSTLDPATVKSNVVTGNLSTAGPHYAERTGNEVETGQVLTLAGIVTIEHNAGEGLGLYNTYWSLVIDGTNHYLQNDGTWGESAAETDQVQPLVDPGTRYGERGINLATPVPFRYVSEAAPASGAVRLRLYGSSDKTSSDLDTGDVLWDDVAVMVTDTAGETLGAKRTELFIVDQPDQAREDIVVVTGEGPAQTLPTTLQVSGTNVADWTSARLASARDLDVLHAETVLRSQTTPLANLHESYRGLAATPIAPITKSSVAYVPQALTLSLYHQEAEGEFVELKWDSSSAAEDDTYATDPAGTTYTPQAQGGVVSDLSPLSDASVITTKGDLIVGDEDGLESRLGVGTDGQVPVADSAADLGISWQDPASTLPVTTKGDLVATPASGIADRFPVGTDGQILIADSTQPFGIRWGDPTSLGLEFAYRAIHDGSERVIHTGDRRVVSK